MMAPLRAKGRRCMRLFGIGWNSASVAAMVRIANAALLQSASSCCSSAGVGCACCSTAIFAATSASSFPIAWQRSSPSGKSFQVRWALTLWIVVLARPVAAQDSLTMPAYLLPWCMAAWNGRW